MRRSSVFPPPSSSMKFWTSWSAANSAAWSNPFEGQPFFSASERTMRRESDRSLFMSIDTSGKAAEKFLNVKIAAAMDRAVKTIQKRGRRSMADSKPQWDKDTKRELGGQWYSPHREVLVRRGIRRLRFHKLEEILNAICDLIIRQNSHGQ